MILVLNDYIKKRARKFKTYKRFIIIYLRIDDSWDF